MKHLKTYNEYSGIEEDAVTGQDSKVTVDDVYIAKLDRELKGAEILGAIKAAETEGEFKDYFYSEYGQDAFAEGEMDVLVKYYLDKETEDAEGEKEEEKDAGKEEEGGDDDLDLDI